MLDLSFVRSSLELVEKKLRDRGQDPAALLGDFRKNDENRRKRVTEIELLRAEKKKVSEEVGRLKRSGEDASILMEQSRVLADKINKLEFVLTEFDRVIFPMLMQIPNLPADDVPVGKSEHDNVEVKKWGTPRTFDFTPKPHWEIGEELGILDLERGAKLSGARFAVYWGAGARLERALASFMVDIHTREHGYTEVLPPFIVNGASLFGTGQLPKFAEDLFRCADPDHVAQEESEEREKEFGDVDQNRYLRALFNDHWLIPTAEVPLTNLFRDETLEDAQLPLSLTAYTPCFRSEAGSYGKDVRGIIRQHQFQKVEMVKFSRPEESMDELEKLTRNAETILERLGLPYRRVLLCTGDMGFGSAKTFDLEVWLPGQQAYREISSCSNCGDFQARRAGIRYRAKGQNKAQFLHTLNGSGLAVGRTWLAILENYQQADGSVTVPEALVPYMGGETVIRPRAGASLSAVVAGKEK
ncbi:serine--tRNA ligase [Silvibacterium dinghuense]|uniref:Serine--tRNA ligase n=1 Tax=Silvibacterium dinghuense TaxID=1560006 RepID=A0A4Q1SI41_9BACT|nr:serine--tRNA ligase [Silvibacterium dinghuense]RXS96860.1 serine--tRNA ligase [Silvibacterium dinghuense]GGG94230.1 serine--tRNA ligase [Silvibacterium dinghuense]